MAAQNVKVNTEELRKANTQIGQITEGIGTSKTELLTRLEAIYANIVSDAVVPKLKAYNETLEKICANTISALTEMSGYLDGQIKAYEAGTEEGSANLAGTNTSLTGDTGTGNTSTGGSSTGDSTAAGTAIAGGIVASGLTSDTGTGGAETGGTETRSDGGSDSGRSDGNKTDNSDVETDAQVDNSGSGTETGNRSATGSTEVATMTGARSHSVGNLRICTDGAKKSYGSRHHQYQTSHTIDGKYLEADIIPYVVVPAGQGHQKGSLALVVDNKTGNQVYAIVGDVGRSSKGYGEVSLKTAWDLGYKNADGRQNGGAYGDFTITVIPNSKQDWKYNGLYDQIQAAGQQLNS